MSLILTPAATLRPGAAQTCQSKQDHGLEFGLDLPELIGACASALPDDGAPPQPVYYETAVTNTDRWDWRDVGITALCVGFEGCSQTSGHRTHSDPYV